jgi:hypothetical protein
MVKLENMKMKMYNSTREGLRNLKTWVDNRDRYTNRPKAGD